MSVEWRLSIGNRFTGLVVCPDPQWRKMWRIHYGGRISDMLNLTRAKDAAISWARSEGQGGGIGIRWERRETSTSVAPNEPAATSAVPGRGVTIVVKEYERQGLFDAYLDGRWLCRSHAPLLSAARARARRSPGARHAHRVDRGRAGHRLCRDRGARFRPSARVATASARGLCRRP